MRAAPVPGNSPGSAEADRSATASSGSSGASSSSPLSPSGTLPSALSRLPYELLHAIFLFAAVSSSTSSSKPPHGGTVRAWHSHERAAPFALVCKAWRAPAQSVLFTSVSLIGHRTASLFVRTARDPSSSHLSKKTASLVLGLDSHVETSRDNTLGQLETSQLLVSALEACPSAVHVHLRPLAQEVRVRLLTTLFDPKRRVKTIILAPRVLTSLPWSGNLWLAEDARAPVVSLENLEITTFVRPAQEPLAPWAFPPLALRRLKVHSDYPMEILAEAMKQSPRLEFVDLYFERHKPLEEMFEALRVSAANTTEMRYICNLTHSELQTLSRTSSATSSRTASLTPPPETLFDSLLPLYTRLTYLRVSATDISPLALRSLPSTLRKLHVKSFSTYSRFTCAGLLDVLRSSPATTPSSSSSSARPRRGSRLVFPPSFEELVVVDSPEHWPASSLDEVRRLLTEERGVRFTFKMDFEEDDETTTAGSASASGVGSTRRSSVEASSEEEDGEGSRAAEEVEAEESREEEVAVRA
ncbi:hypothetical protein JCM6882_006594 [Rhodosporidiobolus microsporus]